jgi:hypothetical protein
MSRISCDLAVRVRSLVKKCCLAIVLLLGLAAGVATLAVADRPATAAGPSPDGMTIFRFDTFGDEQLWTDQLRLHEVIESSLDPLTALQLGLKVDVDALPDELVSAIRAGKVDLTDPATTLALIRLNAVVGVVGKVEKVRAATGSRRSVSRVRCATPRWTIRSSRALAAGSTVGLIWTSIPVGSSLCRRHSRPRPRRSTTPGGRESTIPGSTSTA